MDDQSRLEHERVRNHGILLRIGVFRDVEVFLNRSSGIGEEGPLCTDRRPELLQSVVVIGGVRGNPRVCHSNFRIERGKLQMLLVFLRARMPTRKRQDQGASPSSSLSLRGAAA